MDKEKERHLMLVDFSEKERENILWLWLEIFPRMDLWDAIDLYEDLKSGKAFLRFEKKGRKHKSKNL